MKKVAIFDVDGTIFRSSLTVEVVEVLIAEELIPKNARDDYMGHYTRWIDRQDNYEKYIAALVRTFQKHLKGVPFNEFERVCGQIAIEHQHRVYRYTRDLIQELRDKRYFLLAISQSPKVVLDTFCKSLGFHKSYGRFYEIGPQAMLTGNVVDLHLIANKANIVRRVLRKEGLTLKGSIGIGDTETDISFLELVETPICFNPNKKLYSYAKRNGWSVVVERKDVVYKIQ